MNPKPAPIHLVTAERQTTGPVEEQGQGATGRFTGSQLAAARWDGRNEARPGATRSAQPDEKRLRGLGYTMHPIGSLRVLNSLTESRPDAPLSQQVVGPGGYDIVCSGTFVYEIRSRGVRVPAGPVVRGGALDSVGVEKGQRRGAVAVLADGTIRMARTGGGGSSLPALQAAFASHDNALVDLCGGGALLLERGAAVPGRDLHEVQRFESGGGGFDAPQLKLGMHVAVGICEGTAWWIVAHSHTGLAIQQDLLRAGFGTVVVFDGGAGGYVRDAFGAPYLGRELQGFGIRLGP